jgi:hypothetical protein
MTYVYVSDMTFEGGNTQEDAMEQNKGHVGKDLFVGVNGKR